MGLPGRERSLTISVWSCGYNHERDGYTDRRTDGGRQQRPRVRIASRGIELQRGAFVTVTKVIGKVIDRLVYNFWMDKH